MRVVVFGATGPTGALVVDRALAAGHTVTAFTRHPETTERQHPLLRLAGGDVLDAPAVERAVAGQEAVISVYGVPFSPLKAITVYSRGAANIVAAMERQGVPRYVGVTSGGTSTRPQPGSSAVFEWFVTPVLGRTHYADQRRQEAIVMASGLRWTIARPALLVDGPATGRYRAEPGYVIPGELATVRADLAAFLVGALADSRWERQAVAVATPGARAATTNPVPPLMGAAAGVAALGLGWYLLRRARRP